MKKVLLRIPVLLVAFLTSVIFFSSVFNRGETVNTTDFSKATMPVLYMKTADTVVNPMYGYTKKMQENSGKSNKTVELRLFNSVDGFCDEYIRAIT